MYINILLNHFKVWLEVLVEGNDLISFLPFEIENVESNNTMEEKSEGEEKGVDDNKAIFSIIWHDPAGDI